MNDRLTADLGRWEQGELRADELREFHPDGEPDELLQMHARVALALSATDEAPDLGWEEIEARLDLDLDAEAERDDERGSRRRRVPVLKLVVAFVAGALVNPFQPAEKAVDGMRAVARSTAEAVVEEVTNVFEPMIPPRTGGVLVLDPGNTQNLSAVAPEALPPLSDPTEPGESTSGPVSPPPITDPVSEPPPRSTSEPSDAVTQDPVESDEPAAAPTEPGDSDDSEETTAPSDPAPAPDHGPPSTPPGEQRRADRSPVHGGEQTEPVPPGHSRQPTSSPGHTQRPTQAGVAGASASASSTRDSGPSSKMAGEQPGKDHRGAGDRGKSRQ